MKWSVGDIVNDIYLYIDRPFDFGKILKLKRRMRVKFSF